ncbi:MAG: hypothetical protein JXR91_11155, partial [Deltaproteobacteria bacterium]|nr:hypothetical protein [Deltaproteobacteria bacterium]
MVKQKYSTIYSFFLVGFQATELLKKIVLFVLVTACSSEPDVSEFHLKNYKSELSALSINAPSNKIEELSDKKAKEFVDKLFATLKNRDFEGYQALYAIKFDATVRDDFFTRHFTREQWLSNPISLYKTQSEGHAENINFLTLKSLGIVTFSWIIKKSDREITIDKKIVLGLIDSKLLIVKEKSNKLSGENYAVENNSEKPEFARNFFPVIDNRYVILEAGKDDIDSKGALFINSETAVKPMLLKQNTKKVKWMMKQKIIIVFKDGTLKKSQLIGTRIIAKYRVHYSMIDYWKTNEYNEIQRGEDLWSLALKEKSIYLAATIKPQKKEVLFVMVDNGNEPEIYKKMIVTSAMKNDILKRIKKKNNYKNIQNNFTKFNTDGVWSEFESDIWYKGFKNRTGKRKFISININAGSGCGEFYGSINNLYRTKQGVLIDIGFPSNFYLDSFIDDHKPYVAIDIDRNGFPEFAGN